MGALLCTGIRKEYSVAILFGSLMHCYSEDVVQISEENILRKYLGDDGVVPGRHLLVLLDTDKHVGYIQRGERWWIHHDSDTCHRHTLCICVPVVLLALQNESDKWTTGSESKNKINKKCIGHVADVCRELQN